MRQSKYSGLVKVLIISFLSLESLGVLAQDSAIVLSLQEAVASALNNNKTIQLAKLDESIAQSTYRQTNSIFLPQLDFSYTAISTNNPLNAFGFKLQQNIVTQNDFNPAILNNPGSRNDFTTKIDFRQPLINMDMLYKRKAAAKQIEVYGYKTQRTSEYLTFEVHQAYLQLQLAYEAIRVLEDALQTSRGVYSFTENHYKQGLVQKSDLLNAQVQVTTAETSLAKAKNNLLNASDYLSVLMGQKEGVIYQAENALQPEIPGYDSVHTITESRSDFLAMQTAIGTADLMIKANKRSYLPKLNAFGSYQLNDNSMFGFGANAYLVGVQLSWSIFRGSSTKHIIAAQVAERNKLQQQLIQQKEQGQLELNKTYRDLSDARFDIKQQTISVEQASESLLILQNRYRQGLVNTTDILMASTQLLQKKMALAQAIYTADVMQAYLQLLTIKK
jgi:outer membrane protein TolC